MLKPFLKTIAIITLAATAAGCTMFKSSSSPQTDQCTKLKRELLYNENNRNIEANWATSEQHAQFKQQLKDAHCK